MTRKLHSLYSDVSAFPSQHRVALRQLEEISWAVLQERCEQWQAHFSHCNHDVIALYHEDALEFTTALLALWRLGKTAAIAGNNLPLTCRQLDKITTCLAGDFGKYTTITPPHEPLSAAHIGAGNANASNTANTTALIVFTSGSSGEPEAIYKSFEQLDNELSTLSQFSPPLSNHLITGTVSHQHMYGLIFRLLLPLVNGQAFTCHSYAHLEDLIRDAKALAPFNLISSPVHLSRLPEQLDWNTIKASIRSIISAGAVLPDSAANTSKKLFGIAPIEIYGSSETGAVAFRTTDTTEDWHALPGINIRQQAGSDVLEVQSPFLAQRDWFSCADRCQIKANNQFQLNGRIDKIIKLAGKRIAINHIENTLKSSPLISDLRIAQLPERGDRLGAAVILTAEGNGLLIDQGRRHLNKHLAEILQDNTERVAIPRYWRYCERLPYNNQGKTTQADIQNLFNKSTQTDLPIVNREYNDLLSRTLSLYIPDNISYFEGHFQGQPVLPGVVQTHWAIHYGREYFGIGGEFQRLESIKFQRVITPGLHITLSLNYQPEKMKLTFSYSHQETILSSGRIQFGFPRGTEDA